MDGKENADSFFGLCEISVDEHKVDGCRCYEEAVIDLAAPCGCRRVPKSAHSPLTRTAVAFAKRLERGCKVMLTGSLASEQKLQMPDKGSSSSLNARHDEMLNGQVVREKHWVVHIVKKASVGYSFRGYLARQPRLSTLSPLLLSRRKKRATQADHQSVLQQVLPASSSRVAHLP